MAKRKGKKENRLKKELQDLVQVLEAAGRATLPVSNDGLLRSIVEAAARIFQAAAASILLVNEAEGVLEFKVSTGAGNQDLVGMRFPLDHGIAGYVAMTGQPIAISDVEQDTRFNRDFAQSTGYVPRSILAMPLTSGDRVLGVMEVLDKIDAPSFGIQDMDLLAIFAGQAALAIEMSQGLENLDKTLASSLKKLVQSEEGSKSGDLADILEEAPDASRRNDLLEVAALLNKFSHLGEEERKIGLKVLAAFAEYSQTRHRIRRGVKRR